jgi:hypothetical protein
MVTNAKLAEIFEVENFYVMEAIQNDSAEGVAESNSFIGGNHFLLVHTPSAGGLMTPAAGMTFAWNNIPGANNLGVSVESFSDDALKRQQVAEHIQVKMSYDMRVVGADLGGIGGVLSITIHPKQFNIHYGELLWLSFVMVCTPVILAGK